MISLKPKHLNWSDIKLVGNSSKLNISKAFKPVIDLCENLYVVFSTVDSPYLLVLLISVSSVIDISFWHIENLPNRSFLRLSNGVCSSFTFHKLNKALSIAGVICKKVVLQFERLCWILWDGDNVNLSTYTIDKNLMLGHSMWHHQDHLTHLLRNGWNLVCRFSLRSWTTIPNFNLFGLALPEISDNEYCWSKAIFSQCDA